MPSKIYDYKALVDAFYEAKHGEFNWVHPDIADYNRGFLTVLEAKFGLSLDFQLATGRRAALLHLFANSAKSLSAGEAPLSAYKEAGLFVTILENSGPAGQRFLESNAEIYLENEVGRDFHRQMLYDLFVIIFGEIETTITSEDLLAAGFDDSEKPNPFDYDI